MSNEANTQQTDSTRPPTDELSRRYYLRVTTRATFITLLVGILVSTAYLVSYAAGDAPEPINPLLAWATSIAVLFTIIIAGLYACYRRTRMKWEEGRP